MVIETIITECLRCHKVSVSPPNNYIDKTYIPAYDALKAQLKVSHGYCLPCLKWYEQEYGLEGFKLE